MVIFFLLTSCKEKKDTLFQALSSGETGINFKNTLKETQDVNVLTYSYFYNGGGVAIGDVNNDDFPDIYFTGNLVASHLYINQGNWNFKNIATSAGVEAAGLWNTGVTMADVNNDGWLDIYVCRSAAQDPNARKNLLFINNQDLTFSEAAAEYGLDDPAYSTQASFFDYDRDGDVDLFLLNHSVPEYSNFQTSIGLYKNRKNPAYGDKLYRNDNGIFTDVTKEAGIITNVLGFGLGVTIADVNNDHWLDIYVSNDFNEEDYLYLNQQDGTFKESLKTYMDHTSLFSMGSDAADVNNDGNTDILSLDMLPEDHYRIKMTSGADNFEKYHSLLQQGFYKQTMRNMLQLNEGSGQFREVGQLAGISNTDWSWSALFADYDLDGWQDLFITNGYLRDYTNMDFLAYTVDLKVNAGNNTNVNDLLTEMPKIEVPNKMFKNELGIHFKDVGKEWGFDKPLLSNGAAYGDLDNDGDIDLVVNNVNALASVYKNQAVEKGLGQFLKIKLESEKGIIGTTIKLHSNDQTLSRVMIPTRGYQSSVEPLLHFGLGDITSIDSVQVHWPDGEVELFSKLVINRTNVLVRGEGQFTKPIHKLDTSFFKPKSSLDFEHQEDPFNDFKVQSLLPQFLSREGPPIAVGDVNEDGIEDVVLGGANGQAASIMIGIKGGEWKQWEMPDFEEDKSFEDVGIEMVDVDNDGDQDVVVASGGNMVPEKDSLYQARLYVNEGGGMLKRDLTFPKISIHASTICSADIDEDGDIDIFIGGAYEAWNYPYPAQHAVLLNDGTGQFELGYQLPISSIHISDAICKDIDADGNIELVTVGPWEPMRIWSFEKNHWSLDWESKEKGWWSSLYIDNFDEDLDMEIIVGNIGLNHQLTASDTFPIVNYFEDVDQNGAVDPILTYFHDGVSYPFLPRDDILSQLPGLKKEFPTYSDYAQFTTSDLLRIFPDYQADTINELRSMIFNKKGESWQAVSLPLVAQVAPVNTIQAMDVDGDQDLDVILAGNELYTRVKIGEMDANHGVLLENKGHLKFEPVPQRRSGFRLKGAVKSSEMILNTGETYMLFGVNNDSLSVYQWIKNKIYP